MRVKARNSPFNNLRIRKERELDQRVLLLRCEVMGCPIAKWFFEASAKPANAFCKAMWQK